MFDWFFRLFDAWAAYSARKAEQAQAEIDASRKALREEFEAAEKRKREQS